MLRKEPNKVDAAPRFDIPCWHPRAGKMKFFECTLYVPNPEVAQQMIQLTLGTPSQGGRCSRSVTLSRPDLWAIDECATITLVSRRRLDAVIVDGEFMRDAHGVWKQWIETDDWRSAYPAGFLVAVCLDVPNLPDCLERWGIKIHHQHWEGLGQHGCPWVKMLVQKGQVLHSFTMEAMHVWRTNCVTRQQLTQNSVLVLLATSLLRRSGAPWKGLEMNKGGKDLSDVIMQYNASMI